jgi:phosphoribosylanthranilate isomerase
VNAGLLTEAALADFYLFDTFLPDTYGGTGKTFSLSLLKGMRIDKPFFLAGGLDADNVAEIIRQVQKDTTLLPFFYGVDVSGGIETDGYKDTVKMEAFMKAIRG